ncbi:signal peptidase I [Streptomyces sp. CB01881]|nr:signal peptidase I [Streptomyces sp. CB01881]TYC75089.1 signal peptidase I [Streptomyces sp. CB01881]
MSAVPRVVGDAAAEAAEGTEAAEAAEAAAKADECPEDGAEEDVAGDDGEEDAEEPGRSRSRDLLLLVGICLLSLLLVNAFVARPFAVPSASMENTLRTGDRLVANKLAYSFGSRPQRGDVVVFDGTGTFRKGPTKPTGFWDGLRSFGQDLGLVPAGDSIYVKRVIGVGGDRVTSTGPGGRITVNGVPVDESSYLAPGDEPSNVAFDVVVPPGTLWVMGDHRSASRDSRDHLGEPGGGFVPEDKVVGRAEWVVFPVGHWSSLDRPEAFAATGGTGGHGDQR